MFGSGKLGRRGGRNAGSGGRGVNRVRIGQYSDLLPHLNHLHNHSQADVMQARTSWQRHATSLPRAGWHQGWPNTESWKWQTTQSVPTNEGLLNTWECKSFTSHPFVCEIPCCGCALYFNLCNTNMFFDFFFGSFNIKTILILGFNFSLPLEVKFVPLR